MSILKTKNLSFTYPQISSVHHATINDISFSLDSGETIGIIGHTGSGKSTLLQTLNGLIKPDSGMVFLNEKDLWENPKEIYQKRFKVGLVFQYPEYQLFEETAYKDIAYGPKNMGLSDEEIDLRINEYSALLGITEDNLNKSPFELSGGEKRRVALAGILAMEPDVLVLDEPTAGLDPIGRTMLFNAIKEYQIKTNAGVIIVSHSMEDLSKMCDKLLVLSGGEIKKFGSVKDVFLDSAELNNLGLDVPMVTRVMLELKAKGLDIRSDIFTVDEAAKEILNFFSQSL
ncbi:MAG: energy-coupling factor transporter ATPase [Clostridia bacterium]|nr:energy-coupling factor transporter ATPase [Clostridia bacterium]